MIRASVLAAFFASSVSAQQLTAGDPTWICPVGNNAAQCADLYIAQCLESGSSNSGCTSGLCSKPPGCYTGTEYECSVREHFNFPGDGTPTMAPVASAGGPCSAGAYGDAAGTGAALSYPTSANFYGAVPTFDSSICPSKSMMCTLNGAGLIPIGSTMGSFSCSYNGASISIALNPNTATSFTATTPAGYAISMMVGTTTAGTASYGYFIVSEGGQVAFGSSNAVSLSVTDGGSFDGVYVCIEPMADGCKPNFDESPSGLLPYLGGYAAPTNAPVTTKRPSRAPTTASPTKAPQAAQAAEEAVLLPADTPTCIPPSITGDGAWNQGKTAGASNIVAAGQGGLKTAPDCPMTESGYSLRCVTQEIDGQSTNYGVEFWVPGGGVLANVGDTATFVCQVTGCDPQDMTDIMIPVLVTNVNGVAYSFDVQDSDYVITMLNMKAGVDANMVSYPIGDTGTVSGRSSITASPPYLNGKYQGLSHINLCIAPVCAICGGECSDWPNCQTSASAYFTTAATTTAATVAKITAAKPKGNSGK